MNKNQAIKDFQRNQKQIGTNYYTFANECENPNLKGDFLTFSREESDIVDWLSYELDEGALPSRQHASAAEVSEAYKKYSSNF